MNASIEQVQGQFAPGKIGCKIVFLPVTDSTNTHALRLPAADVCHGQVLIARKQTAGRGRQNRSWHSEPDKGLHFTVILLPKAPRFPVQLISLAGALGIYDAISEICEVTVDLKWPNDVHLNGKKVSGILCETTTGRFGIERIALGMSINVLHDRHDFPEDFRGRATSIALESGRTPDEVDVFGKILSKINVWYDKLAEGGNEAIVHAFARRSSLVHGKRIRISAAGGEELTGTTCGLNNDGTLLVRLDNGTETTLHAGDVHLL